MKLPDFTVIILAAGGSSRMGSPKQLLQYKGKTLLQHVADEALASGAVEVIVVTNTDEALKGAAVKIISNRDWQSGMSSSIRAGLENVKTEEIILVVCDQPYVTADFLKSLIVKKVEAGKNIAASRYVETLGTPVAFNKIYFPDLGSLKNDEGAKKIIMANLADVVELKFAKGEIDIDTPEDYRKIS